jgi:hypothetical protein
MSISNLLVDNNFNLFCNSIFTEDSFSSQPNPANPDQVLNPAAATRIIFDTALVTGANYSLVTSSYTAPANGVYTFQGTVEIEFQLTLGDDASVSISLLNGVVPLKTLFSTSPSVAALGTVTTVIPFNWYGFLAAGSVISVQANIPTSLAHGAGNFALYVCNKVGTIFIGKRGS